MSASAPLLAVKHLSLSYRSGHQWRQVVHEVSFDLLAESKLKNTDFIVSGVNELQFITTPDNRLAGLKALVDFDFVKPLKLLIVTARADGTVANRAILAVYFGVKANGHNLVLVLIWG